MSTGKVVKSLKVSEVVQLTREIIQTKSANKKLILVRSCENIGSLSGCLNGWIDAKISEYGRKQAKHLSVEYFSNFDNRESFGNVYTSDLLRAKETADICLGHDFDLKYISSPELREIYFGEHEGLFYDGLPQEEKKVINKTDHKFPKGEAWVDVKYRCIKFIDDVVFRQSQPQSNNKVNVDLVFTHGGFITSMLYSKNIKTIPPNGSVTIVSLSENLDKGIYKAVLNEYSKQYNCADEAYNASLFEKYNSVFEEYLDQSVEGVEMIYQLPDLSEELL